MWIRASKYKINRMKMLFQIYYPNPPISSINFHSGGKDDPTVNEITVTYNYGKKKYTNACCGLEGENKKEISYKIPKGFVIVGVRIPCKVNFYSETETPVCGVIIMKDPLYLRD